MKKTYVLPYAEFQMINSADIITASGNTLDLDDYANGDIIQWGN